MDDYIQWLKADIENLRVAQSNQHDTLLAELRAMRADQRQSLSDHEAAQEKTIDDIDYSLTRLQRHVWAVTIAYVVLIAAVGKVALPAVGSIVG